MGFSENTSKKHILLTGPPAIGKSTIIQTVVQKLSIPANGFYTVEERIDGKRLGFITHTLDGTKWYLAHQNSASAFRISSYGVNVENIETLGIPAILPRNNPVIIIDEIGLMQCLCDAFIPSVKRAMDSDSIVIGTISLQNIDGILEIKKRPDVEIIEVTIENRNDLPEQILTSISSSIKKYSN